MGRRWETVGQEKDWEDVNEQENANKGCLIKTGKNAGRERERVRATQVLLEKNS